MAFPFCQNDLISSHYKLKLNDSFVLNIYQLNNLLIHTFISNVTTNTQYLFKYESGFVHLSKINEIYLTGSGLVFDFDVGYRIVV